MSNLWILPRCRPRAFSYRPSRPVSRSVRGSLRARRRSGDRLASGRAPMADLYDPYMPEILTDPYPVYARLRREKPVYYVERFNAWALARFEDIWEASQDTE